jgi:hypothetical protein
MDVKMRPRNLIFLVVSFKVQANKIYIFSEQEANLFEYQLMHHQPNAAGHLSGASSSADPHVGGAADSAFSTANTAAFPGATSLKQLPTLFQWDFKTTTETPSGKSAQPLGAESAASPPRSATAQNRPAARPAISSKAPRTTTAVAVTTKTTPVTVATTTQEEDEEETPATASRIPKIYLNNPKIDPFTESPALAPEVSVFNKLCFFNLFILLHGLSLNFEIYLRIRHVSQKSNS